MSLHSQAAEKGHKFLSFRQRVDNLKFDVGHKIGQVELQSHHDQYSYFSDGCSHWKDLNLSTDFCEFLQEANAYSNSLAQVVHHQAHLAKLLLDHIAKGDQLSLEPLLDLTCCLARDLSADFVNYLDEFIPVLKHLTYQRDADIIEWSFNCLSKLFKSLRRHISSKATEIVRDLSDLLGKGTKRQYLIRFTAEAISYLLKNLPGDQQEHVLGYVFDDYQRNLGEFYKFGITHLMLEIVRPNGLSSPQKSFAKFQKIAMLATDANCHDIMVLVFNALLKSKYASSPREVITQLLVSSPIHACLKARITFEVCVSDRSDDLVDKRAVTEAVLRTDFSKQSVVNYILPAIGKVLLHGAASMRSDFVTTAWQYCYDRCGIDGCIVLCMLLSDGQGICTDSRLLAQLFSLFPDGRIDRDKLITCLWLFSRPQALKALPSGLVTDLIKDANLFIDSLSSERQDPEHLYFQVWKAFFVSKILLQSSIEKGAVIDAFITKSLSFDRSTLSAFLEFGLLADLLELVDCEQSESRTEAIVRMLCIAPDALQSLEAFAQKFQYLNLHILNSKCAEIQVALENQLRSQNRAIRKSAFFIMKQLERENPESENTLLASCSGLFDIEFSPANMRFAEKLLRDISIEFDSENISRRSRSTALNVVYGLLYENVAPLWTSVANTLSSISDGNFGHQVFQLAYTELTSVSDQHIASRSDASVTTRSSAPDGPSPFDGERDFRNRLSDETDACSREIWTKVSEPKEFLWNIAFPSQSHSPNAPNRRTQAMRVLLKIPPIAELKNREMVPLFLSANTLAANDDAALKFNEQRKMFLELFAKFDNPNALHRFNEVNKSIYHSLASGDGTVQRLSLDFIKKQKLPEVSPHIEVLYNLIEDTKQRDELVKFSSADSQNSQMFEAHENEIVPLLMRLLYGQMISRKHSKSQSRGLQNRRKVILSAIAGLSTRHWGSLIQLMTEPFEPEILSTDHSVQLLGVSKHQENPRILQGFLEMAHDVAEEMSNGLSAYMDRISRCLIGCLLAADKIGCEDSNSTYHLTIAKNMRQSALKTLHILMSNVEDFDWENVVGDIFSHLISPRLSSFPQENSQAVSAIFRLVLLWSSSPETSQYLQLFDSSIVPQVVRCLNAANVKQPVVEGVLELVNNLTANSRLEEQGAQVSVSLLSENMELLLQQFGLLFPRLVAQNNAALLEESFRTLSHLPDYFNTQGEKSSFLDMITEFLRRPDRLVSLQTKSDILFLISALLPANRAWCESAEFWNKKFGVVMSQFAKLASSKARKSLAGILHTLATFFTSLEPTSKLVSDLNAYSQARIDQPDFTTRLHAFRKVHEVIGANDSTVALEVFLHNAIFFVQDEEELSIRSSASNVIRKFIEACEDAYGDTELRQRASHMHGLIGSVLKPFILRGVKIRHEDVRAEICSILASCVQNLRQWEDFSNLTPLLASGDQEANFFNNILHIQMHRRERAVRRLRTIVREHVISSQNIVSILMPLISHSFHTDTAPILLKETIQTFGILSYGLSWNAFRNLFEKRLSNLGNKSGKQASNEVELIGYMIDTLCKASENKCSNIDNEPSPIASNQLERDLPTYEEFEGTLVKRFYEPIIQFLQLKDEESLTQRIPLAIPAVRLVKLLRDQEMRLRLPSVVMNVSQILKSRSQQTRDSVRKAIAEISTVLGAQYFPFILNELRGTLTRGYQLHVLGYTLHSILLRLVPASENGSLDHCVQDIAAVLLEDIIGEAGQQKQEEDYVSRMKEVRSSKSNDSFEQLASMLGMNAFPGLLTPVTQILQSSDSPKLLRQVDEILRRITLGCLRNEKANSTDILTLCYGLFNEINEISRQSSSASQAVDSKGHYIVDLNDRRHQRADHFHRNSHRLIRFVFNVLRGALSHNPHLITVANLSQFVPIIGDCMLSPVVDTKVAAMRCLSLTLKIEIQEIQSGAPVFLREALNIIKESPNLGSENAQSALKFVSSMMKERPDIVIDERAIAYLLIRLKSEVYESDRQGVVFSVVRSVLSRKLQITEVYDLMEEIQSIMVTNQSKSSRDAARSLYMGFLVDYPHSRAILTKRIQFVCKNLQYQFASGRQSALELLYSVSSSFPDSVFQQFFGTVFLSLSMSYAEDDDNTCRVMAEGVLKLLISRADDEREEFVRSALRGWVKHPGNVTLNRCGLAVCGVVFDVMGSKAVNYVHFFEGRCVQCAERLGERDAPETLAVALNSWLKFVQRDLSFSRDARFGKLWQLSVDMAYCTQSGIKAAAYKLLGLQFSFAQDKPTRGYIELAEGVTLNSPDLHSMILLGLFDLGSEMPEDQSNQTVKNLVFLTKWLITCPESVQTNSGLENEPEADLQIRDDSLFVQKSPCHLTINAVIRQCNMSIRKNVNIGTSAAIVSVTTIVRYLRAVVHLLPVERVEANAEELVRCLYRFTDLHEADQVKMKAPSEEAREVLSELQERIGTALYAEHFNNTRQRVQSVRQGRHEKRALEAVADPEKAAKKRAKHSLKNHESRKRKTEAFKYSKKIRKG